MLNDLIERAPAADKCQAKDDQHSRASACFSPAACSQQVWQWGSVGRTEESSWAEGSLQVIIVIQEEPEGEAGAAVRCGVCPQV